MIQLINGDCIEVLKTLPDNSVDSVVTDPPYELGFMGKSWDNTGIANSVEMWSEVLRVLKPGGHLLSFGGTRTYHRMACAIEDAGFEVRDMIEWVYGSGFDKCFVWAEGKKCIKKNTQDENDLMVERGWGGWGRGGLKPSHEPICMARKPISEKTVALNVLKWGTGGINIDESRVETSDKYSYPNGAGGNSFSVGEEPDGKRTEPVESNSLGRFPANLIHDGSDEVKECFPSPSPASTQIRKSTDDKDGQLWNLKRKGGIKQSFGDSGNASRFFYCAKASKSERNMGIDVIEDNNKRPQGEAFGDGSAITEHSERKGNFHPTVKPLALMEYLIKLVTPKGGTVLDPFMGSGTTGIAAKKLGYNFIGIEKESEYIKIAEARINSVPNTLL